MKTLLFVLAGVVSARTAQADSLQYTVTPSGAQYSYSLTLINTGATGGTLYDLFLSIPQDISNIDTTTIGTPVGWGDPTGGLLFFGPDVNPSTSFIEWAADFSGSYDVQIGNSLGGLSFLSSQQVTSPITFALNGSTTFDTAQAVSTPEPTSKAFLLAVIMAILLRQRRLSL